MTKVNLQVTNTIDTKFMYINTLVYGPSGIGKTRLALTVENPFIISIEGGTLSLRGENINKIEISSSEEVYEAIKIAMTYNPKWLFIDSLSELSEIVLTEFKDTKKDVRQAYQETSEFIYKLIRYLKCLNINVCALAKIERIKDEYNGRNLYGPAMVGEKLPQRIPGMFDDVLYFGRFVDPADNSEYTAFQVKGTIEYVAKVRSKNVTDFVAEPHLGRFYSDVN